MEKRIISDKEREALGSIFMDLCGIETSLWKVRYLIQPNTYNTFKRNLDSLFEHIKQLQSETSDEKLVETYGFEY